MQWLKDFKRDFFRNVSIQIGPNIILYERLRKQEARQKENMTYEAWGGGKAFQPDPILKH